VISNLAIIDKDTNIAADVSIGPYTIIGKGVEIGSGTEIGPNVVIEGPTKIGRSNIIYQFAALGAAPQHKGYHGEVTRLEIGDENVFREHSSAHRGTEQGHKITKIGNRNYFMNYSHIAHDCIVGDDNTFANIVSLAGHVTVGNCTVLSGYTKVAQFCSVGDYVFTGGNADICKDVLPYVIVSGTLEMIRTYGLNLVGLRRRGFSEETIANLRKAYNIIIRRGLIVKDAIVELEKMLPICPEVQRFIDVLISSKKGVIR